MTGAPTDEEIYGVTQSMRLPETAPAELAARLHTRNTTLQMTLPGFARQRWVHFVAGRPVVVSALL